MKSPIPPGGGEGVIEEIREWVTSNHSRTASPLYAHVDVNELMQFLKTLKERPTPDTAITSEAPQKAKLVTNFDGEEQVVEVEGELAKKWLTSEDITKRGTVDK